MPPSIRRREAWWPPPPPPAPPGPAERPLPCFSPVPPPGDAARLHEPTGPRFQSLSFFTRVLPARVVPLPAQNRDTSWPCSSRTSPPACAPLHRSPPPSVHPGASAGAVLRHPRWSSFRPPGPITYNGSLDHPPHLASTGSDGEVLMVLSFTPRRTAKGGSYSSCSRAHLLFGAEIQISATSCRHCCPTSRHPPSVPRSGNATHSTISGSVKKGPNLRIGMCGLGSERGRPVVDLKFGPPPAPLTHKQRCFRCTPFLTSS